jgi:DNA polymerase-3 subunit alpha
VSEANFTFSGCGCTWPVTGPPAYPGGLPGIAVDFDRVPFCRRVADLFATGRTKGVFQLGKRLGQKWTKSVAPRNREQVAALASVLRPGVLKSKDADGVSITQLYALRNNGQSTAVANSPEEAECLASTYFLMLYQEQLRALAKAVGRFDDLEAEQLQKTAAKKLPEAMAAFRDKFVNCTGSASSAGFTGTLYIEYIRA